MRLKEVITKSFEGWSEKMDKQIEAGIALGELPTKRKTDEELRAEARAIWKKAHSKQKDLL
jgi:hypothetical protein